MRLKRKDLSRSRSSWPVLMRGELWADSRMRGRGFELKHVKTQRSNMDNYSLSMKDVECICSVA